MMNKNKTSDITNTAPEKICPRLNPSATTSAVRQKSITNRPSEYIMIAFKDKIPGLNMFLYFKQTAINIKKMIKSYMDSNKVAGRTPEIEKTLWLVVPANSPDKKDPNLPIDKPRRAEISKTSSHGSTFSLYSLSIITAAVIPKINPPQETNPPCQIFNKSKVLSNWERKRIKYAILAPIIPKSKV